MGSGVLAGGVTRAAVGRGSGSERRLRRNRLKNEDLGDGIAAACCSFCPSGIAVRLRLAQPLRNRAIAEETTRRGAYFMGVPPISARSRLTISITQRAGHAIDGDHVIYLPEHATGGNEQGLSRLSGNERE